MDPTSLRLQLLDNGWSPIPVRGKIPVIGEWERFCRSYPSDDDIEAWERDFRSASSTGIALGRQVCIDIDARTRGLRSNFALRPLLFSDQHPSFASDASQSWRCTTELQSRLPRGGSRQPRAMATAWRS
jgi:hypothetical protein